MAEYISFQPSDFFNTVLWTGTGASQAITGVGFQPDFVWGKKRSGAYFHGLFDSARGATKYIQSDATAAEVTNAESLKTFDADGFTAGTIGVLNEVAATYVGWNWKAGTTTGLTGGTITPSAYSINTTSGFSAIAYTGTTTGGETIPHGLGVVPDMVIIKKLSTTSDWKVYHSSMDTTAPQDYALSLNTTAAKDDSVGPWHDTAPTSTLVTLGTDNNSGSVTYIAYCFANKKGYSKMGVYYGDGNADGAFVYTGFRPAFVLNKMTVGTANWVLHDNKRLGYNANNNQLYPNTNGAADTNDYLDILSNGFKLRDSAASVNGTTDPYIYAAFAEFPIVSSNDIPTVAR